MQLAPPIPLRRFYPRFGQPRIVPVLGALIGLLAVGSAGLFVYQRFLALAPPAPAGQIVPVERGTVAASVSATGNVVATRQAKLVFTNSGRIKEVLVNVGDHVTAGQPLARLVADTYQVKLDTAKSQLATAQLKLQQLTEGATAEDVAAAQAAYDAAVAKLTDLQAGPTQADLAAAQAALAQAQAGYADASAKLKTLQTGATDADRAAAAAGVQSAQNTLDAAQAKLDQLQAGPTPEDVTAAQAGLDQANATLRSAEAKLQDVQTGATQADLTAAQAAFDKAQADLTTAKAKLDQVRATQPVPADVAQAQSALSAAESKLHTAHQTLDQLSDQLAAAYATLGAQQSAIASARQSADATCDKLGGSSAQCASANSQVDQLKPDLLKTQQQIKQLQGSGSWQELAAQKDVVAAQAAYDAAALNLKQVSAARSVPVDLIAAQTAYDAAVSQLTSARAKLDQTRSGATNADLVAAQSAVEQARAGVASAQAKLDTTLQGSTSADMVAAQTAVDTAAANLSAARTKLDTLGVPTPQDLAAAQVAAASAQNAVLSAQAKLDQLKSGPTQTDLEAARSGIAAAQAELATKSGSNAKASDIALQQEAVRQAELAVQQAQIDFDANTLLAPFDGIVAAINGNPGEIAPTGGGSSSSSNSTTTSGGFITLVDPNEVRVDVTVDESDLAKLHLGQRASINFDALPNQLFVGTVIAISPSSTVTQGVVTYPVSLSIEPARFGPNGNVAGTPLAPTGGQGQRQFQGQGQGQGQGQQQRQQQRQQQQEQASRPPAGLTAAVTIVVARQDDVLNVPLRAVHRQGREQTVDVVGEDGKTISRPVRVGVQNDQSVEIVDGLAEGEQILVPTTTTRAPNVGPGPGGPRPGGPGNFQFVAR
jgi:HlyD family secretion protein